MKRIGLAAAILATFLSLVFLNSGFCSDKEVIRIKGSDSMAGMVDSYAAEFMKTNPNCSIIVSGGPLFGDVSCLVAKESEISMSSVRLAGQAKADAEKSGLELKERLVGWGGLVVISNPQNPVGELTVDQVRKIFTGEITNWKMVGGADLPISVFTVGEKRGGSIAFLNDFLKGSVTSNGVVKSYFRSIPPAVAENPGAIGIIRIRNLDQLKEKGEDSKIRVVAMKKDENSPAVLPSRETVNNGSYPITRPYFLYVDLKRANGLVNTFLDFCAAKNPRRSES